MKRSCIDYETLCSRIYLMCKDLYELYEYFNDVSINPSEYYAGNASAYKSIFQFIDKTEEEYLNNNCGCNLRG